MFAQGGIYDGKQVIPSAWVKASTQPSAPTKPGEIRYGYQWWIPKASKPGIFLARGIYGQYIYIDQPRGIVIVSTAADRLFREPGVDDGNIALFGEIADAL